MPEDAGGMVIVMLERLERTVLLQCFVIKSRGGWRARHMPELFSLKAICWDLSTKQHMGSVPRPWSAWATPSSGNTKSTMGCLAPCISHAMKRKGRLAFTCLGEIEWDRLIIGYINKRNITIIHSYIYFYYIYILHIR